MPEDIASWIGTSKGVRQLQYEELAKAKGMDLLLQEYRTAGTKRAIRDGIGLHLWTAALDSIGNWLIEDPTSKIGRGEPFQNQRRDVNPQDPKEEWSWEPPDLAEGSTFFQE
jgi:hypothetical protein